MLVMRIMHVGMYVSEELVAMLMLVVLGDVQPHAGRHQTAGDQELSCDWFAESGHRRSAA